MLSFCRHSENNTQVTFIRTLIFKTITFKGLKIFELETSNVMPSRYRSS